MKIYGTAKGGAIGKKDFGVAFSSGGNGGWSPTDISNLLAWWDFSDIDTITKDGSDLISQVDDKSGNDYHLTQLTGANQPTWQDDNRNNLDTADFGSAGFMKANWSALSQPHVIFGVCFMPPSSSVNQDNIYDDYSGDSGGGFANGDDGKLTIYSATGITFASTGFTATWKYFVNTYGSSGDVRMNGVSKATGNTGTVTYNGMTMNRHRTGTTYGDIVAGEFGVYSTIPSSEDIALLETYLSDKWGF